MLIIFFYFKFRTTWAAYSLKNNYQFRDAAKQFANRPFLLDWIVKLLWDLIMLPYGAYVVVLVHGVLRGPCWESRGSPREAMDLRAFRVSGLVYFEDLTTHFKPKNSLQKWLKITISIVYVLHATTFFSNHTKFNSQIIVKMC